MRIQSSWRDPSTHACLVSSIVTRSRPRRHSRHPNDVPSRDPSCTSRDPIDIRDYQNMASQDSRQPPDPGITPGAKVGIAIAAAFGIICLFSVGLWVWWRRRQKRQLAKDMVNFVDGDIVNLVDRGRFEKPSAFKPTDASYDPYRGSSSSQAGTPSPVYYQPPLHFTVPPVDSYSEYYAPVASQPAVSAPSLPPSRDMPPPQNISPSSEHVDPIPPPPPVVDNTANAWSNTGRHPWSPPDYDAHLPTSATSMQADHDFNAAPRQFQSLHNEEAQSAQPVEALPAILPEARPEPQAELPAREGQHGWGFEHEMDAQQPMRRQQPQGGRDMEEQKFLLADVMALRQQKIRPNVPQGGPEG